MRTLRAAWIWMKHAFKEVGLLLIVLLVSGTLAFLVLGVMFAVSTKRQTIGYAIATLHQTSS